MKHPHKAEKPEPEAPAIAAAPEPVAPEPVPAPHADDVPQPPAGWQWDNSSARFKRNPVE